MTSATLAGAMTASRWRRAVIGTAGAAAASVAGFVAAASPGVLAAAIALPLVILVPLVATSLAILADGVAFPLLITGASTTLVNIGVLGSVLLAVPMVLLRKTASPVVLRVTAILALAAVPGTIAALVLLPASQVLSGARYLAIPVVVALLASTLTDRARRTLLILVTIEMTVSFIAAIIETAIGSDRLLEETGLDYGVTIRNIGETLRAPGTFATNYHLGSFAGVFAVVALLWWGSLRGASRDIVWRVIAVVSSIGCLVLSTYRTGLVIVLVAVGAAILLSGRRLPAWVKIVLALGAAGVAVGFVTAGLGSSDSFYERLAIWTGLLTDSVAPFGRGLGYSGAASGAEGAAVQIFTDNYYISLWLQLGVSSLIFFGVFVVLAVLLVRMGQRGDRRALPAACLWIGALAGFAFVELWEYTSAMSLVGFVLGSSALAVSAERRAPHV